MKTKREVKSMSKRTAFGKTTYKIDGREVPKEEYEKSVNAMDEITKVEKILNEFGLKIHAIGADLDVHGLYIETEGFQ